MATAAAHRKTDAQPIAGQKRARWIHGRAAIVTAPAQVAMLTSCLCVQLSLSRMERADARHSFLQQLLEQLNQLADMQPATVTLAHFKVRQTAQQCTDNAEGFPAALTLMCC
jgi:hypothetical protein